jgi:malonyl-CoA/methylmalonyl-CoA synthetase
MSSVTDCSCWIERGARSHPQRLFLSTPEGERFNYADLRDESGRLASALRGLGVEAGDRVAVRVEKSAQAVLLYIACLRLGAAFVPINVACSPNEVEYFLDDSKPRVAVVDPADLAMLEPVSKRAGVEHLVTLGADGRGTRAARGDDV